MDNPLYDDKRAWTAYNTQRRKAGDRGIAWHLTYIEWCDIWWRSGHWENRGSVAGSWVMCRNGDRGPYSIDNVRIDTIQNNNCEARARPFTFGGVVYTSRNECARMTGIPRSTLFYRKSRGYI